MSQLRLKRLTTNQAWTDLALDKGTMKQVEKIMLLQKKSAAINNPGVIKKKVKIGNLVIFKGMPTPRKQLAAALIGKEFDKAVYKIDSSMVVSKYIGETEKNLELLFARAADKDWILFFDEADALFGKRTKVKDSHDRYANQEITCLLQRLEDYQGLAILSTNIKTNIDQGFTRRLHIVDFLP